MQCAAVAVSKADAPLAGLVEGGLPLISRPFDAWAKALGQRPEAVIATLQGWLRQGTLRRFGVVVRHHEAGFSHNAMTVFDVPDAQVDQYGAALAAQQGITLAYRRERAPGWRYNLYCMVMAANFLPNTLALFDADLNLVRTYPVTTLDGKGSSRDSAVYDAAPRSSFVVALKDIAELWEISYNTKAEPIFDGLVHGYKTGEAIAKPGFLGVRRTLLDEPLDDFFFDQSYRHAIGTPRPKEGSVSQAQVVNLDVRRRIASFPLPGMPHLGSGITFAWNGTTVLALPNLKDGAVAVVDMKTWQVVKTIATPGPGFFMRSHENSPYAWVDSMMSPQARDTLTVIDKRTLTPVAHVRKPGRTLSHIEFTRNGHYALASLMEFDGALIVYDAKTLKEVKRLPMRKPIGKYNIWNKISRSEGTSH